MRKSPCGAGPAELSTNRAQRLVRVTSGLVVAALVVPALAVTAARVLPGGNLQWVILRASTPLAIVPYLLAALVLVANVWRSDGAARSVSASTLAVVTSLLCLHVWWLTQPFLAYAHGSPSGDTFSVMTANLHIGRAHTDEIIDIIDRDNADVLVLQEITPTALAELDRAGLDLRLTYRAGSAETGRDGIMVFANAPLREIGRIDSATPGYDVEMATSRGPIHILATHPTAPNNGVAQWSSDLDSVVANSRASVGPTVVAGDFNATLDHPQLRALMKSGFRDASADAGPSWRPTWPSPGNLRLKEIRLPSLFALDHVFIRGPLEATHARTHVVGGTDHRALVTDISWVESESTN